MAGRPRKSVTVHKGKRSKEERLNRKIQESKIKVDRLQLETGAPAWLSEEAAQEYMRIVHEAGKIGSIINVVEIQIVSSQHLFFSRKEVRI